MTIQKSFKVIGLLDPSAVISVGFKSMKYAMIGSQQNLRHF